MPTYQYACTECGDQLEAVQSFSDPALTECPNCQGKLRKVFNSVGIVFKGSGFYRNDSRAGGSAPRRRTGGRGLDQAGRRAREVRARSRRSPARSRPSPAPTPSPPRPSRATPRHRAPAPRRRRPHLLARTTGPPRVIHNSGVIHRAAAAGVRFRLTSLPTSTSTGGGDDHGGSGRAAAGPGAPGSADGRSGRLVAVAALLIAAALLIWSRPESCAMARAGRGRSATATCGGARAASVPVGRAVLEQAVVVRGLGFAPAALGVVAGLLREQRRLLGVEVDGALGVGVALWLIQDVHGTRVSPRRRARLPPSAVPSVNVSTPTGVPDDDGYWQRPDERTEPYPPAASAPAPIPGPPTPGRPAPIRHPRPGARRRWPSRRRRAAAGAGLWSSGRVGAVGADGDLWRRAGGRRDRVDPDVPAVRPGDLLTTPGSPGRHPTRPPGLPTTSTGPRPPWRPSHQSDTRNSR